MYTLLMWLSTKARFQPMTMGQLMFFMKSPHIKHRKKYILKVERILRQEGLSIFEKQMTCDPADLASAFDLLKKRSFAVQDRTDAKALDNAMLRSTWHGLE